MSGESHVAGVGQPPRRTEPRPLRARKENTPKLLSTAGGDVEVSIPKFRSGSFFPELLETRRRTDKALSAVIVTASHRHESIDGR